MTPDVERIALAVQACPAVAGLHSGRLGATVTHLPQGTLTGILVLEREMVVGVVGRYPTSVAEIAQQVRAAVSPLVLGLAVTVHVEDMHVPDAEQP